MNKVIVPSQCTYRCVVLPDRGCRMGARDRLLGLNAPTGAWCSLTFVCWQRRSPAELSQCTYRCVVLPDPGGSRTPATADGLNAPTGAWCSLTATIEIDHGIEELSQCTYRCVVLPDPHRWCGDKAMPTSQCTYRCVVLPDVRERYAGRQD